MAQQEVNRLARDHVLLARLAGDLAQVQEDVVVEPVEADEVLALAPEQPQELRLEDHVEHREVGGLRNLPRFGSRVPSFEPFLLDRPHDREQAPEVVFRPVLPLVVQMEAVLQQQFGPGAVEVVLAAAEQEGCEPAPTFVQRIASSSVPFVGPAQNVVVANRQRIVEPTLERGPALPLPARPGRTGRHLRGSQTTVARHGRRTQAASQSQVAQITERETEHVRLLRRAVQARQVGDLLEHGEIAGGVDVAPRVAAVVLEHGRFVAHEQLRPLLHQRDRSGYGVLETGQPVAALAGNEVDHTVEITLLVELVGRDADGLRALFPGQVVATDDVRQPARLDRVEHPVPDRQQDIRRGQRDRSTRVAVSEHDPYRRHVELRHLGDQPRDRVGLVAAVRLLARVRPGRVHQGDHGQSPAGEGADHLDSELVVLRHPHAVLHRALLRQHAETPPVAVDPGLEHRGVERTVVSLFNQFPARRGQHRAGADATRVLGRGDRSANVLVDLQPSESLERLADAPLGDQPRDAPGAPADPRVTRLGKQGERARALLRLAEQRVDIAP